MADSTDHVFEDVSHHGSPTWECRYCNGDKDKVQDLPCPKAEEYRVAEAERIEAAELIEYRVLVAAEARARYLHRKFNPSDDDD